MRALWLSAALSLGCSVPYRTVVMDRPPIDAWSSAPPEVARICALRPSWIGGAVPLLVHDEGRLVGALGADSYVCWMVEPGRHRLTVRQHFTHQPTPRARTEIELSPGARAYLSVATELDGSVDVEWLDEEEALEKIERCSWEQVVAAPPGERLPGGARPGRAIAAPVPAAEDDGGSTDRR